MSYQKEADETKIVTCSESVPPPPCSAVVAAVPLLERSDPMQTTSLCSMVIASSLRMINTRELTMSLARE